MKRLLPFLFAALLLQGYTTSAQTGIAVPSMHKTDSLISAFLSTWNIPGATVAISKDGRLIYNRAFGWANNAGTVPMQPYNLLRIASNSKAITGIAILKLIENGQLGLSDTVFGAGRILSQPYYLNAITDNRIFNITVKELLEHTGGWDRDVACDGYSGCDPISFPLHVTSVTGEGNPVGDSTLIKFLLAKGLNNAPGTHYAYSNIGYLVLGKVVERKTGMKYDAYVSSVIMQPLGLCDMHLGKNLLADKQEREGEYNNTYTTKSCYGDGTTVPWQYGGWNLEAMNAHGGWISTSADYVRMILAVDGMSTVPDILNASSVATMTTPSSVNAGYAKGWSVNSSGSWWHTGALDGTATFMARTAGGYTWAFHFNSRGNNTPAFWSAVDALPWNCIGATTTFPTHNLFAPATQASSVTASKTSGTTAHVSWTAGSGDNRTVIASEMQTWTAFPADGATCTANATYALGQNLGSNTFVVYAGTGASVDVSGLDPLKTYYFTVIEGSNNAVTGNNQVYKYGCRTTAKLDMQRTAVAGPGVEGTIQLYPNPAHGLVTLENGVHSLDGTSATVTNAAGQRMSAIILRSGKQAVDVSTLPGGVYQIRFANGAVLKLVKQ